MSSSETLVSMQRSANPTTDFPSVVQCGPRSFYPDPATGIVQVPAVFVPNLLAGGWMIAISGGATHVP
jgi:hypothetical protein